MLLLGIDTSTRRVGVVFANESNVLAKVEIGGVSGDARPRHAETLAPAIEWSSAQCGVELAQLSAVAVGIGPGMFTGLRVGVTTAKVLAQSLRIPMIPIPSLDLLAYPLRHSRRLVVSTIDARRHEIYWAMYQPVPGGVQRVSEYELGTPDDLAAVLQAGGEDAVVVRDEAPSLTALAELARARYEREDFVAADDVLPMYLRRSDAELEWDRKGA